MKSVQPFTNMFNLPGQIVSSILNDSYNVTGHISVTSMISPFRMVQLRKRYQDRIVEDVSEQIWCLLGQIGHQILQRSDDTGAIHEERLEMEVGGWVLSGQTDCYVTHDYEYRMEDGKLTQKLIEIPPTIRDYKFTSIFATRFPKPDWEAQINTYAQLWRSYGYPVERGEIIAIFRDWKKMDSVRKSDYPPPVVKKFVRLWPAERTLQFIEERIMGHRKAEDLPDDELPFCTAEEQWRREERYAVMKENRKTALKVFDSFAAARSYAQSMGTKVWVEHRPAEPIRCKHFCSVSDFCNQYRQGTSITN